MQVENFTPFPEFFFKSGGEGFILDTCVLKATYEIDTSANLTLAFSQAGPELTDSYYGDPKTTSLRIEHDRVPLKPRGEVYFVNPISRPPEKDMRKWPASVSVGSISIEFLVTGPRTYRRGIFNQWILTPPRPCEEVPLRYEFSFGGGPQTESIFPLDANPVGTGHGLSDYETTFHEIQAPQIETLDERIPSYPLALTPVHRGWSPRRELVGTLDDQWVDSRWPLYPEDFNRGFYQQAPQQLQLHSGYFRGNEKVEIESIGPGRRLEFTLPESRQILLVVIDSEGKSHLSEFYLDTMVLNLEKLQVSLVWRTSYQLPEFAVEAAILFGDEQDE